METKTIIYFASETPSQSHEPSENSVIPVDGDQITPNPTTSAAPTTSQAPTTMSKELARTSLHLTLCPTEVFDASTPGSGSICQWITVR